MYAIWKYDLFPYKLCAKIIEKKKDNFVTVDGYGSMMFKPLKIVNDTKGEKVKELLSTAEFKYRMDLAALNDTHNNDLAEALVLIVGL